MDMTASTEARSDQINAVDLVQPRTYTIDKVTKSASPTHPFDFHLVESPGKAYRPNLGMRRVIVAGWGPETTTYHGRRLTLMNEPSVIYAGAEIGGIRVSHMSHLDKPLKTSLAINQKKKVPYIVQPLADVAPAPVVETVGHRASKAVEWFAGRGVAQANLEAHVGKGVDEWTDADLAELKADAESMMPQSGADVDPNGASA